LSLRPAGKLLATAPPCLDHHTEEYNTNDRPVKFSCELVASPSDHGKCDVIVNLVMATLEPHQQNTTPQDGNHTTQEGPSQMLAENEVASQQQHQPQHSSSFGGRDGDSDSRSDQRPFGNGDSGRGAILSAADEVSVGHESDDNSSNSLSPEVIISSRRDIDMITRRRIEESQTSEDADEIRPTKALRSVGSMAASSSGNRRIIVEADDDDDDENH
jgi:hypothetical protein